MEKILQKFDYLFSLSDPAAVRQLNENLSHFVVENPEKFQCKMGCSYDEVEADAGFNFFIPSSQTYQTEGTILEKIQNFLAFVSEEKLEKIDFCLACICEKKPSILILYNYPPIEIAPNFWGIMFNFRYRPNPSA
jgi:hypothetical protein